MSREVEDERIFQIPPYWNVSLWDSGVYEAYVEEGAYVTQRLWWH